MDRFIVSTAVLLSLAVCCLAVCTDDCGANGDCDTVDDELCVCKPTFGGAGCSEDCPEAPPTRAQCELCAGSMPYRAMTCTDCNNGPCEPLGGTCKAYYKDTDHGVKCVCKAGFTGTRCNECDDNANGCHGGGICTAGACECDKGHDGEFCQFACGSGCPTNKKCVATSNADAECRVDCSVPNVCGTGSCNDDTCNCPPAKVGDFCELTCPTCVPATEKCRETPSGGAAECATKCTDAASCAGANSECVDDTCSCEANKAGDDCSLSCTAPVCVSTTEVCQETTDGGTAECLVDCSKTSPCAVGGSCANGVCTCAANRAGKFCQHDCDPVCTAGTECKENAAGSDGECSGASALVATWIIFAVAAFSFI